MSKFEDTGISFLHVESSPWYKNISVPKFPNVFSQKCKFVDTGVAFIPVDEPWYKQIVVPTMPKLSMNYTKNVVPVVAFDKLKVEQWIKSLFQPQNEKSVSNYRKPLIIGATVVLILVVAYKLRKDIFRYIDRKVRDLYSMVMEKGRIPPPLDSHYLRGEFRSALLPKIKGRDDGVHTHPASAASRSSAVTLARIVGAKTGLSVFSYQASTGDVRDGVSYSRSYFWAKDLMVPSSSLSPTTHQLVVITDVDYYIDMPGFLLDHDNPVLLYTFSPSAVAATVGEFSFRFDSNNTVQYTVCGGAQYSHKVWDYNKDVITVSNFVKTKSYIIERRKANAHHEYVLFIPLGSWTFLYSFLFTFLGSDKLGYLKVNNGAYNVLDVQNTEGIIRTMAKVGDYNVVSLPIVTFNALASVKASSTYPLSNATVNSWLREGDRAGAASLVEYFKQPGDIKAALVYPAAEGIRNYQIVNSLQDYDPEAKSLMFSFMSPIYPNTFVPDRTRSNERAAVNGRVLKPGEEAKNLAGPTMSKWLLEAMEQFVALLIPTPHEGDPYDVDVVFDRQRRPMQRAQLNMADAQAPDRECKTFMKAEPYEKVSDPRIITTYNTVDKREYARFIYALADHIMEHDWYSFGFTPKEINDKVLEICTTAQYGVNLGDMVRMDGHWHEFMRMFEQMINLRYFKHEHHPKLLDLHGATYNIKAKTQMGIKYVIDYQRGSGSLDTAVFNGTGNKFINFLARRMEGATPKEAFNALGQFAGDDSISPELSKNGMGESSLVKAAAMVGQVLENNVILRNGEGVNYLSRFYTKEVWSGNPSSMCDLPRALGKLHVCVGTPEKPLIKLQQKLMGLRLTDANTPVIREIIITAERLGMSFTGEIDVTKASWWSRFPLEVNWPNLADTNEDHIIAVRLPGVTLTPLFDYLRSATSLDDLLKMPCIKTKEELPPVAKNLAVVEGVVLPPPPPPPSPVPADLDEKKYNVEKFEEKKLSLCAFYAKGKCRQGDKCHFSHGDVATTGKVCNDFQKGGCTRTNCKYAHVKSQINGNNGSATNTDDHDANLDNLELMLSETMISTPSPNYFSSVLNSYRIWSQIEVNEMLAGRLDIQDGLCRCGPYYWGHVQDDVSAISVEGLVSEQCGNCGLAYEPTVIDAYRFSRTGIPPPYDWPMDGRISPDYTVFDPTYRPLTPTYSESE